MRLKVMKKNELGPLVVRSYGAPYFHGRKYGLLWSPVVITPFNMEPTLCRSHFCSIHGFKKTSHPRPRWPVWTGTLHAETCHCGGGGPFPPSCLPKKVEFSKGSLPQNGRNIQATAKDLFHKFPRYVGSASTGFTRLIVQIPCWLVDQTLIHCLDDEDLQG